MLFDCVVIFDEWATERQKMLREREYSTLTQDINAILEKEQKQGESSHVYRRLISPPKYPSPHCVSCSNIYTPCGCTELI